MGFNPSSTASASVPARRSSSRGVPASCCMCCLALIDMPSTPACAWASCDSKRGGEGFGKAGRAIVHARAIARGKADHSGGHRSHAAAIDSSSHPGTSHIEATSQGNLPASRKLAARPRCRPQARDTRTVPPVTLANPWPTIMPLNASTCTGDERVAAASPAAAKGTCNATVIDALPNQNPRSRTGWLQLTREAITACMNCGHDAGLWRHRPESSAKPRAIAAQDRMWDR